MKLFYITCCMLCATLEHTLQAAQTGKQETQAAAQVDTKIATQQSELKTDAAHEKQRDQLTVQIPAAAYQYKIMWYLNRGFIAHKPSFTKADLESEFIKQIGSRYPQLSRKQLEAFATDAYSHRNDLRYIGDNNTEITVKLCELTDKIIS